MPKTKTPKTAARVYRAASYARLSVDDESYGTSGSVLNQHAMIRDFADATTASRAPPSRTAPDGAAFSPTWRPARSTASWSRT